MTIAADELQAIADQLAENFKTRDIAALADMYTADAVMLPPGAEMIIGREDIQSFWQQFRQLREFHLESEQVTQLAEDLVRQVGRLAMLPRGGGAQGQEVPGKFVFLWRLVEGDWKVETAIWNRTAAGQPGRGRGAGGRGPRMNRPGPGGGPGQGGRRPGQGPGRPGQGQGQGRGGAPAAFVPRVR